MPPVNWFRPPADGDSGTLNVCYEALDIHVVRGRADDVALTVEGEERSFARLLTEVAACAGVLRAFGVGLGDRVVVAELSPENRVVVPLAVARVGAVAAYDNTAGAAGKVRVDVSGFGVDADEVPWDVAMRAGRTDPAGCADVPGDGVMATHGDDVLTVLQAVGASDDHRAAAPAGATLVEVGGVRFWSFGTA
ncbi:propionyl-CoA synthetase [Nocardioides glacieisoli]|uniref:propionyl-CoA synthetase n=1 Tax=Nocardioides glacieisoli TaxID=1168730 RepID=UPI0013E9C15F|nr:propionyl-CoA synthetase [Nocardioides glacieisoli]